MTLQRTATAEDVFIPDPSLEVEPTERWVRVQFNGEYVADSKRVLLLREKGRVPTYYFPEEDVRFEFLEAGRQGSHGQNYWNVRVADRAADAGAWTYPDPEPARSVLRGYVAFKWNKMDHWYEEEEEVYVHPRDPYKRVDAMPSSRHVRVEVGGVIVADTTRPYLLFETGLPLRYYIPQEDVRMDLLEPTSARTRCPYKGESHYWTVNLGEEQHRNIVWGYPDPIPEIPKIKGLLCFYNEKVDIFVDGDLQVRPESPWL
jgi:uncharacterized protein (DUF427 family)